MKEVTPFTKRLMLLQGLYFLLTAVWPLVHISSFMYVTGPKTDIWLVKTVSVLILAISLGILRAAFRELLQPDVVLIAISSAMGLICIDVYYSLTDVIADIYLYDALAEAGLILAWVWALKNTPKRTNF